MKVEIIQTKDINAVASLVGSGSALKTEINSQGTNVGQNQTIITRKQRQEFEAAFRQEISENWETENDADRTALENRLKSYMDSAFVKKEIPLDNQFGKALAGLSSYGFSPTDISPDEIQKFGADLKQSFQEQKNTVSDLNIAAKADVVGIGGSASANLHSQESINTLQDLGWKFELQGTVKVPKSLEVNIVNDTQLKSNISVNLNLKKLFRGFQPINSAVDTTTTYHQTESNAEQMVPVATIVAFAGNPKEIPAGWLLCNGDELPKTNFPALAGVLSNMYGVPSNPSLFKIPDYRGRFLRGQNHDAKDSNGEWIDPDRDSRVAPANGSGNSGDNVGSVEPDLIRDHQHAMSAELYGLNKRYDVLPKNDMLGINDHTGSCLSNQCGKETRPKNMYVNFLIKY